MRVMLAGKFIPDRVEQKLPIYGQPKLDGIRMFVRDGVAYTRSLKPVRSEWVQELVSEHAEELEGLDGEIIAGDPTAKDAYRRTNSSVMSYAKPDDVTFHVFDSWDRTENFANWLLKIRSISLPQFCSLVDTRLLSTMDEITAFEEELLAQGHEGVILRDPLGLYKFGRATPISCELIKVKRFTDAEARVTGFAEFRHNANEAEINDLGYTERSAHQENLIPMGTLGALLAEGRWPDGTKFRVRIGTGLSMEERQEIWDNQHLYLGKIVKFKFFPGGVKEAPRFPVFLGWRDEDDADPVETAPAPEQLGLFEQ